jgi:hypothetical protein
MEQTFAAQAGFEHEAELVTGYVDLLDCKEQEIELTPAAVYTEAVLDMTNSDLQVVAGQEGFLDSIKRGAVKVYEWIKSIIRAIRNWFSKDSKHYAEAKKELTALKEAPVETALEELVSKGTNSFKIINLTPLKRMGPHEKIIFDKEIKEKAKEELEKIKSNQPDPITDGVVNEIANKVAVRMNQITTRVNEIRRIDPTGETMYNLGIKDNWNFLTDASRHSARSFSRNNQEGFSDSVHILVWDSENAQKELSNAVSALEKMNEANKNNPGESKEVSRAGAIVKELAEIAAMFRDCIITINSLVIKAEKTATDKVIKAALKKALDSTDKATSSYLQKAFDDFEGL